MEQNYESLVMNGIVCEFTPRKEIRRSYVVTFKLNEREAMLLEKLAPRGRKSDYIRDKIFKIEKIK